MLRPDQAKANNTHMRATNEGVGKDFADEGVFTQCLVQSWPQRLIA
jgi:hypothetical protein